MEIINDIQLPYPILKAMMNDPYDNKGADYSVSSLYDGPKMVLGKKRLGLLTKLKENPNKELYDKLKTLFPRQMNCEYENYDFNKIEILPVRASERIDLLEGSMQHDGLEHRLVDDPEFIVEKRLSVHVPVGDKKVLITGAFDCFCKVNNTLYDYKSMKAGGWKWRESKIPPYSQQVNIYRLLMKLNNMANPQRLMLVFIIKGWNELDAKSHDYPPRPYMQHEINILPDHEIIRIIREKIQQLEAFQDTPTEEIPYCSKEQRWESDPIWKICKKKADGTIPIRPRAIPHGKFESLDAAEHVMRKKSDDYFIHEESGMPKRCFKFCEVHKAGFCDWPEQWTANRSETTETGDMPLLQ